RRSAQCGAQCRDDDRSIHQNRMREHEVDQLSVAPVLISESQLCVERLLGAYEAMRRNSHGVEQTRQRLAARRLLQILDDRRLDAGVAYQSQRVARSTAGRVVI